MPFRRYPPPEPCSRRSGSPFSPARRGIVGGGTGLGRDIALTAPLRESYRHGDASTHHAAIRSASRPTLELWDPRTEVVILRAVALPLGAPKKTRAAGSSSRFRRGSSGRRTFVVSTSSTLRGWSDSSGAQANLWKIPKISPKKFFSGSQGV